MERIELPTHGRGASGNPTNRFEQIARLINLLSIELGNLKAEKRVTYPYRRAKLVFPRLAKTDRPLDVRHEEGDRGRERRVSARRV